MFVVEIKTPESWIPHIELNIKENAYAVSVKLRQVGKRVRIREIFGEELEQWEESLIAYNELMYEEE